MAPTQVTRPNNAATDLFFELGQPMLTISAANFQNDAPAWYTTIADTLEPMPVVVTGIRAEDFFKQNDEFAKRLEEFGKDFAKKQLVKAMRPIVDLAADGSIGTKFGDEVMVPVLPAGLICHSAFPKTPNYNQMTNFASVCTFGLKANAGLQASTERDMMWAARYTIAGTRSLVALKYADVVLYMKENGVFGLDAREYAKKFDRTTLTEYVIRFKVSFVSSQVIP